jgi:N-methylhydantoinase B
VANVEVNESYLPLRYLQRRELADSGGPGRWRGGVGTAQVIVPHRAGSPVQVLSFGQGLQQPCAAGVAGGWPGGGSGFAVLDAGEAVTVLRAGTSREVPMPHAAMAFGGTESELVVSQGGGGLGDPIERDPDAVAADVAEGLVSAGAARRVYGVVLSAGPGAPHVDAAATDAERQAIRSARLGGGPPAPPASGPVPGRPFSWGFAQEGGRLRCRRCGTDVAAVGELWDRLSVTEVPTTLTAPLGLRYPGADGFVLRVCCCPACGRQVDVQVGRRSEPLVVAAELF